MEAVVTPVDREIPTCTECEEMELASAVFLKHTDKTDTPVKKMLVSGEWHTHDEVNEFAFFYECSLGHTFSRQYTGRSCTCGWVPPEQQSVIDAEAMTADGIFTTDIFGTWE